MGAAWKNINKVFSSYPNVYYEVFNEPFGYADNTQSDWNHYVSDMNTIISDGGLTPGRCILDGLHYASDINHVASGGWTGYLGYHFYPSWLGSGYTESAYSNPAQAALGSWGQKTWVTEFGGALDETSYGYSDPSGCYDTYTDGTHAWSPNVNCLRGLDDALRALKAGGHGVLGAFVFHGWDNGDSYDYWARANANGACKEMEIETHD